MTACIWTDQSHKVYSALFKLYTFLLLVPFFGQTSSHRRWGLKSIPIDCGRMRCSLLRQVLGVVSPPINGEGEGSDVRVSLSPPLENCHYTAAAAAAAAAAEHYCCTSVSWLLSPASTSLLPHALTKSPNSQRIQNCKSLHYKLSYAALFTIQIDSIEHAGQLQGTIVLDWSRQTCNGLRLQPSFNYLKSHCFVVFS